MQMDLRCCNEAATVSVHLQQALAAAGGQLALQAACNVQQG
jgi:hypothetical protein